MLARSTKGLTAGIAASALILLSVPAAHAASEDDIRNRFVDDLRSSLEAMDTGFVVDADLHALPASESSRVDSDADVVGVIGATVNPGGLGSPSALWWTDESGAVRVAMDQSSAGGSLSVATAFDVTDRVGVPVADVETVLSKSKLDSGTLVDVSGMPYNGVDVWGPIVDVTHPTYVARDLALQATDWTLAMSDSGSAVTYSFRTNPEVYSPEGSPRIGAYATGGTLVSVTVDNGLITQVRWSDSMLNLVATGVPSSSPDLSKLTVDRGKKARKFVQRAEAFKSGDEDAVSYARMVTRNVSAVMAATQVSSKKTAVKLFRAEVKQYPKSKFVKYSWAKKGTVLRVTTTKTFGGPAFPKRCYSVTLDGSSSPFNVVMGTC